RLHAGRSASQDELRAWCQARLASFKVPRYWQFIDTFPMTVTGKVQKFRLREMAIELLSLHTAAAEKTASPPCALTSCRYLSVGPGVSHGRTTRDVLTDVFKEVAARAAGRRRT